MKQKKLAKKAAEIANALEREYPDAACSLEYMKPYELLFATRLAAQCTDERVNKVTPELFARYPTLRSFAEADTAEVEGYIRSCGFFRIKARDIVAAARMLTTDYGGEVPDSMEELLKLPGVGRKIANLILGDVFGKPAVVVDTHCIRLTNRMGLADTRDPAKIEARLREILPPERSNDFCHRLVLHGRAVCSARRADCGACCAAQWCDTGIKTP
ncbi:MAG: endonuclease III [Oscillospiraceae bacterium]|jgi:endonuclease-3|nr:endonuclease III [Oscillospiraceae bacterium]